VEKQDALRAAGVNEVIIMAVNDGAVMQAWAKNQKTGLSMLSFMGDPNSKLTKALVSTMSLFQFETIASASGLRIINVF